MTYQVSSVQVSKLKYEKIAYSQDVQWMDIMYVECTGIKYNITSNQDYFTDEEELDEEDNPVQVKMDETELSEQEMTQTFKDESEMPPGEA